MTKPSVDYRQHLRDGIRLFATVEELSAVLPRGWRRLPGRGINHLTMADLEAAYELVIGMSPHAPADYLARH